MQCNRCGTCCKSTFFALKDVPIENDTREIGKWAAYHGVNVMKYNIDGVDYLAINLPGECQHLGQENGVYYCKIYENRPNICKIFYCNKCSQIQ